MRKRSKLRLPYAMAVGDRIVATITPRKSDYWRVELISGVGGTFISHENAERWVRMEYGGAKVVR